MKNNGYINKNAIIFDRAFTVFLVNLLLLIRGGL